MDVATKTRLRCFINPPTGRTDLHYLQAIGRRKSCNSQLLPGDRPPQRTPA
jgi:hypothetical protein